MILKPLAVLPLCGLQQQQLFLLRNGTTDSILRWLPAFQWPRDPWGRHGFLGICPSGAAKSPEYECADQSDGKRIYSCSKGCSGIMLYF